MIYPKIPIAQSLIEIIKNKAIKQIIISPGSRNAPLTIGFVNQKYFDCYSIVDERCAAFFALGIAQQTNQPTAIVCTSGSALLNYYPAIAEAFYSQIPLIVISADRPSNKIDIGDGQTIRQENVFLNHILFSANLTEDASIDNDAKINAAIDAAIDHKGPVHINIPFEEPLYEVVDKLSVDTFISTNISSSENSILESDDIIETWNNSKKILILTGVNQPNIIDNKTCDFLANHPAVTVLTEVTSNIHQANFINSIDQLITNFNQEDFENFKPDLLITFGGMVVSKRVKAFLRKFPTKNHWHIDPLRAYDTFSTLTKHIKTKPQQFFDLIIENNIKQNSDYFNTFYKKFQSKIDLHENFNLKVPYSDFKAYSMILPKIPQNSQLQISNSAAIRYAQLFKIDPSVTVFCNRGTSGIDGSTSTAIGAAIGSQKQTTLLTGDIGFLYDSNALWNKYIPKNFKIIIINNGGGGIFRILPGHTENDVFNTFFETEHCLTAEHLAKMYHFEYFVANDENSLEQSIESIYQIHDKPCILEVFTPTKSNNTILKDYFKSLQ